MSLAPIVATAGVTAFSWAVNLPLGYVRERHRRLSLPWLAWVHAGVPAIVYVRHLAEQPRILIPMFIAFGVLGQHLGSRLHRARRRGSAPQEGGADAALLDGEAGGPQA